ncbi:translation termination factor GTPase eRF3 [Coemansia sp. RSA 1646]|nr:translation termination factor GTPase eRF3 [Coemansia sp. RSA 1646]KAJ1768969.1 translation termination factor GTPase eRF3 [Coemansia sp. RSA 1843]
MSNDNNSSNVEDVAKKLASSSLSSKAMAFKPTFNAKAPAFVPRPTAATPVAPAAATAAPAAAPKPMTISIGGSSASSAKATPEPKKTEQEPEKAEATASSSEAKKETPVAQPAAATSAAAAAAAPEPVDEVLVAEEEMLLDEHFKEHLNIIFIGHVDAGKSTLGGNILFLTGMVDARTMEKYEREAREAGRESWYLSWALDTNQEERSKGKTVECGRASFESTKRRYTILDAPGHKNFVPSMLSGAGQADVGVLVISARRGEFETGFDRGGQTREHAVLAKTAGVRRLIVAINKMDDPTVEWSRQRYDEIKTKLTPFLKAAGYNPRTDLIFLPISGFTGAGVKDRAGSLCPWYTGPSLLETLDDLQAIDRKINGPVRIPISEKFNDMGTIISGKIESGHIKVNQKTFIMPGKIPCEVGAIYGENDIEEQSAVCGDNVRIRLRGVKDDIIQSGFVLSDTRYPSRCARAFNAQLVILDASNIITAGYKAVLHVHMAVEEVVITKLLHKLNKQGQKSRMPPPFVKKNEACIVRIEAKRSVCVERFKDFMQLGRFTLRDEGKTIAIGKVVKLIDTSAASN